MLKRCGRIDKKAGIVMVEVEYEGNIQASAEEVATIVALTAELMGRSFIDKEGGAL